MLKKRLIGVVIVKDGWAVQSFGYNRYLPLGKPECLVENLDRWGADEIMVLCIDRYRSEVGPDFELLKRLGRLGLTTPLIYGGGIRTVDDGIAVIHEVADRICVDSLLHDDKEKVRLLSSHLGAQAIIASLPLAINNNTLEWLDYRHGATESINQNLIDLFNNDVVSEALVIDWRHEGIRQGFDPFLIDNFPSGGVPLILFGGLSDHDQMLEMLTRPNVAAVAVGNFLSYQEHAIQVFKEKLTGRTIRAAAYEQTNSILNHV